MSKYNSGEMIRLYRVSKKMSQEVLSEDICSVEALSRIENGKQGTKFELYKNLMHRLGGIPEKSYEILDDDMKISELRFQYEDAMKKNNFDEAEMLLKKIKKNNIGTDSVLVKQYILREETLLSFYLKKINAEEFAAGMEAAISMTVPDYMQYINSIYPFTEQEIHCLKRLAIAYNKINMQTRSIEILKMLLRCLDANYIADSWTLKMPIRCNLAKTYGELGEHEKALKISIENLDLETGTENGPVVVASLVDIAWNMLKQIEQGEREKQDIVRCKKYLEQAYYIATARNDETDKRMIQEYYERTFNESVRKNIS